MKLFSAKTLAVLVLAVAAPLAANAQQLPGEHPGYLHALTDLRTARWFLYHQPGDAKVSGQEDVAINEIDAAINEIKHASIDDHKDLNDHPAVDVQEHGSKLLKAIETLKKAKEDITREEDNPQARELRHKAVGHIDRAIKATEKAHDEWLKQQKK
jgi:hypothetical protein